MLPFPPQWGKGLGDGGAASVTNIFKPKRLSFWESLNAWIFVSPWVLGFILFTGGPILASLVISFTNWDIVNPPQWARLEQL